MSSPIEYCLNRDVRVLALVNAMRIVVAREAARPAKPERKRAARSDARQLTLKIGDK